MKFFILEYGSNADEETGEHYPESTGGCPDVTEVHSYPTLTHMVNATHGMKCYTCLKLTEDLRLEVLDCPTKSK